jgi:hypothetical protein
MDLYKTLIEEIIFHSLKKNWYEITVENILFTSANREMLIYSKKKIKRN